MGGGTSGVYQLYELASGSNRDNIIGAIKSIIEDRSVDPKVVAELIQIASDFDISQVDEHVENVLKNSTMMSHEPVKQPWILSLVT